MSAPDSSSQLVVIPDLENAKELTVLTPESALTLKQVFTPFFAQYLELSEQAGNVAVNDPKTAREVRLKLRKVRTGADSARKKAGEDALKYKKGVDGIYKLLEDKVSPLETKLENIEKAEELAEKERKDKLRSARTAELMPLFASPEEMPPYDLADITEAQFNSIKNTFQLAKQARDEAAKRAEYERLKAEKEKEEENKRIREENERLAREAEIARKERELAEQQTRIQRQEMEAKARAEREKFEAEARKQREEAEAKARQEREAREKLEKELRVKQEAENARIKAEEEAKRKAAAAPDKEKLIQFANAVRALPVPALSPERESLTRTIRDQIEKFAVWAEKQGMML